MTNDKACLYMYDISPCSDSCHETMTTDRACFILEGYITMLWPLSWDDDNWRSMIHILGKYYQALTVVIIRWQPTEHVSYKTDILQGSDCCNETMTTDGAWFIPKGYITMLRPLSFNDDHWQSMVHNLGMYNNSLSVVMRRLQLTEHVSYMNDILQCSDRCHETMTADGAWFMTKGYITMLWPLSSDDDN